MAQGVLDLDGKARGCDSFFGLEDTYAERFVPRLCYAFADVQTVEEPDVLRRGRQLIHGTPEPAWFDGALRTTRELDRSGLQIGAWGGVQVLPYEGSSQGDAMFGLFVQQRPCPRGRVRLDWMQAEDDGLLGAQEDHVFALEIWQGVGDRLLLEGSYSRFVDGASFDPSYDHEDTAIGGFHVLRLATTWRS